MTNPKPNNTTNANDTTEDLWHNDDDLLGALVTLNQALDVYVTNALDARAGKAQPYTTLTAATLGSTMVEIGNALQGKLAEDMKLMLAKEKRTQDTPTTNAPAEETS